MTVGRYGLGMRQKAPNIKKNHPVDFFKPFVIEKKKLRNLGHIIKSKSPSMLFYIL
jgi:hypothetical protein